MYLTNEEFNKEIENVPIDKFNEIIEKNLLNHNKCPFCGRYVIMIICCCIEAKNQFNKVLKEIIDVSDNRNG